METSLFCNLFTGTRSSKHERIEDFTTELISFMWEIYPGFKNKFIEFVNPRFKKKITPDAYLYTQETVRKSKKIFRYDIVIEEEGSYKWIIENKLYSPDNQFEKYLNYQDQDVKKEEFLLLISKQYPYAKDINSGNIIYWESLILYLKKNLFNSNKEKLLIQLHQSFLNFLFDSAGLFDDTSKEIPKKLLQLLDKHSQKKTRINAFLQWNRLFPLGFHKSGPCFGIEIEDFSEKRIEIILRDSISKKRVEEKLETIHSGEFKNNVSFFEEEQIDNSVFILGYNIDDGLNTVEEKFKQFIGKFYETEKIVNKNTVELKLLISFLKRAIELSGGVQEFKEFFIRYYVKLKNKQLEILQRKSLPTKHS